jgi:hypothetical protein
VVEALAPEALPDQPGFALGVDELSNPRTALPSAISTLPRDYLDGNAEPLMLIVEALKRSFLLELPPLMDDVLASMRQINTHIRATAANASALNDARAAQDAFVAKFDPRVKGLKQNLKTMSELTDELVDRV